MQVLTQIFYYRMYAGETEKLPSRHQMFKFWWLSDSRMTQYCTRPTIAIQVDYCIVPNRRVPVVYWATVPAIPYSLNIHCTVYLQYQYTSTYYLYCTRTTGLLSYGKREEYKYSTYRYRLRTVQVYTAIRRVIQVYTVSINEWLTIHVLVQYVRTGIYNTVHLYYTCTSTIQGVLACTV